MAFQWILDSLPSWRSPPETQARSQSAQSDSSERIQSGRVTKRPASKSPSVKNPAKRDRSRKSERSTPPPRYIYTIPAYEEELSDLSTASIVTSPSGSSLDSEERYLPKHKIKENLAEFDFDREAEKQRQQLLIKQHSGLCEIEIQLFNQISMVGLEPLLPLSWQHDFPTFPDPMFINTAKPEAPIPFIYESRGSEYAAIRALKTLLPLGTHARNRRACRLRPEPTIALQIRAYYRWAEQDAMLHTRDYVPALIVEELKAGDSHVDVVDHAETRLQKLGKRYRARYDEFGNLKASAKVPKSTRKGRLSRTGDYTPGKAELQLLPFRSFPPIRDPVTNINVTPRFVDPSDPPSKPLSPRAPVLYGILIWHTLVKFVSYDTARVKVVGKPGEKGYREDWSQVRAAVVADFDFSEEEPDVWNALSLASMIVWVRDQLAQDVWGWGEGSRRVGRDPDL